MKTKHKGISKKLGLKPGSVIYVGKERTEEVHIDVIDYIDTEYNDVNGIHQTELVEKLGQDYGMHSLVLEDIVNTGQRPKFEDADDYIFVVLKMLYRDSGDSAFRAEQVSVLFGKNWVITFQETGEDVLDIVRKRIKKTVPRVRFMTTDYLAYALIDTIVDHYFLALEQLGDEIESLDDAVSGNPESEHLDQIRDLKKQLIFMRKAVWPLREVIGGLERTDPGASRNRTSSIFVTFTSTRYRLLTLWKHIGIWSRAYWICTTPV